MMELFLALLIMFVIMRMLNTKKESGFVYAKYPFANSNTFGSLPNPLHVKRGYIWTPVSKLKKEFKESDEKTVFIDNFRIDEGYAEKSEMSKFFKKRAEKTNIFFDPLKLTQGILLVGKMGSGKTEWFFNILSQKFYNRALIHQVKAGDFAETLLRKNDILFSPYDCRGYLWDVMSEPEGILKTFFENLASIGGDKKDFFSAAANRLYNEMAIKVKTKYSDASSAEKWLLLIKAVKDLFVEMDSGTQNSKKDIKGTMEAILENLEMMAWQMQNPKQKHFVIKDFFAKNNQCRLILDNIPEYEKALTPLFTAFTACVSQVHTSMPDSKTNFTLYALDEYLSFLQIMDDASKKRLHTLIRSKGGILIPAIQYVPKDDKKLQQLLTSSAYAWIYFSVIEEETINLLKQSLGETEYSYEEVSESRNGKGEKTKSYSTKNEKTHVIYNELLNGLGDKFEHIVYLPNHKMLYMGYTPQKSLPVIAKKSVPIDLTPFYEIKYSSDENDSKEDVKNLTFADLFKSKPLSKIDEYRLFKKFEQAKKDGEHKVKNFKKENGLVEVNLEFLFQKYMQNDKVIENKMRLYSKEQRFELHKKWTLIQDDDESQLRFIEENDLFGALPAFFKFDEDDFGEI